MSAISAYRYFCTILCALVIKNIIFSNDLFTIVETGKTVSHMRSTNSKQQPSKQLLKDRISCLTKNVYVHVLEDERNIENEI